MSTRALTIAGFVVLSVMAAGLYLAGRTGRLGLAPLGDLINAIWTTTLGRLALVAGWAWLGWHLLAR